MDWETIYKKRFAKRDSKNEIWKILCTDFFQKFIKKDATVLDIAAGYCEFINNIRAKRKIAFDLNPEVKKAAEQNVESFNESCESVSNFVELDSVDIIFISNFLEHLDTKEQIIKIFGELYKVLKKGGKVLIVQPNIKYAKGAYWDFIDHKLPLTEKALIEAGEIHNFKAVKVISKFLPYTTRSKMPKLPLLIKLYLKLLPISGFFFGQQSFIVLEK